MARSISRPYLQAAFDRPAAPARRDMGWPLVCLAGFLCGALAVLIVQEGTLLLLHAHHGQNPLLTKAFGATPMPYQLDGARLGLPPLVTKLLWGGGLGIPLAACLCRGTRVPMLAAGAFFGVGVAGGLLLVVMPALQGQPILGLGTYRVISVTLLLSAGWGWGAGLLLKLISRR
jgi:hypothetical protein